MTYELGDEALDASLQQQEAQTAAALGIGMILFILCLGLVLLCVSIFLFVQLMNKDAELPADQKVFGPVCMIGYLLVCFFTPICFLIGYYCITLSMINDRKSMMINSPKNNMAYDQAPIATAEVVSKDYEHGSPASTEEEV